MRKMELVLSPGRLGDNDGNGNIQNEDIQEWSHIDRLTGMLERARIETGRWQTKSKEAAHSYGKVIDSRERNSADGNVVQRARRQVEVFQSQRTDGKSFQVVRASQWSSSRITDSTSNSPVPITANETQHKNETDEHLDNENSSLSRLARVPRLCQQIHNETVNSHSSSKSNSLSSIDRETEKSDVKDNKCPSNFLNNKKFSSNEDITNLSEKDDIVSAMQFTRDCKTRRSLQISNSSSTITDKQISDCEQANRIKVNLSDLNLRSKPSIQSTHSIHIKNDTDTYLYKTNSDSEDVNRYDNLLHKFDVSARKSANQLTKSYVLGMDKTNNEEMNGFLNTNNIINHKSSPVFFKDKLIKKDNDIFEHETYKEYRRPIVGHQLSTNLPKATHLLSTGKANTTVVHLSDNTSSCQDNQPENIVTVKLSGIKMEPISTSVAKHKSQPLSNRFSNENLTSNETNVEKHDNNPLLENDSVISLCRSVPSYEAMHDDIILDDTKTMKHRMSIVENLPTVVHNICLDKNPVSSDETVTFAGRPIKKVEFCKTEIHFAADSGKVNIVETDGKPPPSNRFRRRRRNNLIGSPIHKNVPLIHFGDTSYEKYIFGAHKPFENDTMISSESNPIRKCINMDDPLKSRDSNESHEHKNEWGVKLKSILEPTQYRNTFNRNYGSVNENLTNQKHQDYTTTMNLAADILSKIKQINQDEADFNNINKPLVKNISDTTPAGLIIDIAKKECVEADEICNNGHVLNIKHESNGVLQNIEHNQVLLNVVTTHEPVIARVESDHSLKIGKQQTNKLTSDSTICEEKVRRSSIDAYRTTQLNTANFVDMKHKAKEHCDNGMADGKGYGFNDDESTTDPMYVNVFHSMKNDIPIYENYHTVNSDINKKECFKLKHETTDTPIMESKHVQNKSFKPRNKRSNAQFNHSSIDSDNKCFRKPCQPTKQEFINIPESKLNNIKSYGENRKIKQMRGKSKSKGPLEAVSATPSIESNGRINETTKNQEIKHFIGKSTHINNSTSDNYEKFVDTDHNNHVPKKFQKEEAIANTKSQTNNSNRLPKMIINDNADKKVTDSMRLRKPVEIVHKTAVFHMKNEKLLKPWKVKESKAPRYINDIICGSKSKRPVDKRVKDSLSKL